MISSGWQHSHLPRPTPRTFIPRKAQAASSDTGLQRGVVQIHTMSRDSSRIAGSEGQVPLEGTESGRDALALDILEASISNPFDDTVLSPQGQPADYTPNAKPRRDKSNSVSPTKGGIRKSTSRSPAKGRRKKNGASPIKSTPKKSATAKSLDLQGLPAACLELSNIGSQQGKSHTDSISTQKRLEKRAQLAQLSPAVVFHELQLPTSEGHPVTILWQTYLKDAVRKHATIPMEIKVRGTVSSSLD